MARGEAGDRDSMRTVLLVCAQHRAANLVRSAFRRRETLIEAFDRPAASSSPTTAVCRELLFCSLSQFSVAARYCKPRVLRLSWTRTASRGAVAQEAAAPTKPRRERAQRCSLGGARATAAGTLVAVAAVASARRASACLAGCHHGAPSSARRAARCASKAPRPRSRAVARRAQRPATKTCEQVSRRHFYGRDMITATVLRRTVPSRAREPRAGP